MKTLLSLILISVFAVSAFGATPEELKSAAIAKIQANQVKIVALTAEVRKSRHPESSPESRARMATITALKSENQALKTQYQIH